MRTFIAAGLLLASALASAAPVAPASNHPILGIWELNLPEMGCSETYRFRADGTTLVMSAKEVSESEFRIPDLPSDKGFYKLDDRITKDNGGLDCAGQIMKVGATSTNYVRFNATATVFIMCVAETLDEECIGPFRRVIGQDI